MVEWSLKMHLLKSAFHTRAPGIYQSGCTNIAMLGLLPSDQISKICKQLTAHVNDPIVITAIQEQLL
jgi:hypothetical protein